MRKFSDRIKDLESLTHLYPSNQLKDVAFNRYYSEDEQDTPGDPTEYKKTVLATKVKGLVLKNVLDLFSYNEYVQCGLKQLFGLYKYLAVGWVFVFFPALS